ncbi:MAG: hypothetical protein R3181_00190 [Rubricoccaceae bacterium]|nr:hypothetical protein [Rubricoccaceae bacterium]
MPDIDPDHPFWRAAQPLLDDGSAQRGTMMGFTCLRTAGRFFATADHRTGDLVVKLPRPRVAALIAEGLGQPFAPAGRTFREWVAVPQDHRTAWPALLGEAHAFVADAD